MVVRDNRGRIRKTHDIRKKDGLFEGYFVCATKTIAAPPADVFKAWSSGTELSKWFGGATKAEVKDGGLFKTRTETKASFFAYAKTKTFA